MDESLTQPCRVPDEGPQGRKRLLYGKNPAHAWAADGTVRISTG